MLFPGQRGEGYHIRAAASSAVPKFNRILLSLSGLAAEGMLKSKTYFNNGALDKDALVNFIKDVKKNTKLSDEDAAILAASK